MTATTKGAVVRETSTRETRGTSTTAVIGTGTETETGTTATVTATGDETATATATATGGRVNVRGTALETTTG
jgi:hypothetical protein